MSIAVVGVFTAAQCIWERNRGCFVYAASVSERLEELEEVDSLNCSLCRRVFCDLFGRSSVVLLATSLRTSGLGDVAGEVLPGLGLSLVRPCGKTPSSSQYCCFVCVA